MKNNESKILVAQKLGLPLFGSKRKENSIKLNIKKIENIVDFKNHSECFIIGEEIKP